MLRFLALARPAKALAVLGLAAGLVAAAPAAAQERIAAIINDDIISVRDLNDRVRLALLTTNQPDNQDTRRRIAPQVLRGVVDEALQVQEAERLGLIATQEEIELSLNDIAARNNMAVPQLFSFLERNGVATSALQDQVRAQVSWIKIVQSRIRPRVAVADEQVNIILDQQQAQAGEPQLKLSEILLPVYSPDQEPAVRQNAQDIIASLSDEADFTALAQQFSVGANADTGGDLGWVSVASLPPNFQSALAALPPGTIAPPLRSPQGLHIIRVDERRSSAQAARDRNEVSLAQLFFALDESDEASTKAGLAARANAIRPRIGSCNELASIAASEGDDGSGLLGWLDPNDLPAPLHDAVAELAAGEVSPVVEGPSGLHLLMVCETRNESNQDEVRRGQIRQRLVEEQTERLANRYLRDLRLDAFIDLRL